MKNISAKYAIQRWIINKVENYHVFIKERNYAGISQKRLEK